uniref:Uncharacterized protein n=1 Tax=Romanomermis culicivorax TaxID=13658 RepID=A0A915I952_ROMCU
MQKVMHKQKDLKAKQSKLLTSIKDHNDGQKQLQSFRDQYDACYACQNPGYFQTLGQSYQDRHSIALPQRKA